MSNPVTEVRSEVAAALGAIEGIKVFGTFPAMLTAPAAVVLPGDPYMEPGAVQGEVEVTLTIRLYAKAGVNEVVSEQLDFLIYAASQILNEYGVWQVSRPGSDPDYNAGYLVTDITIKTSF